MKMYWWGMYWRYLASIAVMLLLVALIDAQLDLVSLVGVEFLPIAFWGFMAVFFIFTGIFQRNGFLYFFWGYKLALSNKVWLQFNAMLVFLFVALAVAGYIINEIASANNLLYYKLYGQMTLLIFYPLFVARFVAKHEKTS